MAKKQKTDKVAEKPDLTKMFEEEVRRKEAEQSPLIVVHSKDELHALERQFAEASKNDKVLPVHKLPDGMNRNNSVQDFLMVIIEELWRIEDMLHDKA